MRGPGWEGPGLAWYRNVRALWPDTLRSRPVRGPSAPGPLSATGPHFIAPSKSKPVPLTGVCEINAAGPYKFIGLGGIDVAKPYKFTWFGDIDAPKTYEFIRSSGFYFANTGISALGPPT